MSKERQNILQSTEISKIVADEIYFFFFFFSEKKYLAVYVNCLSYEMSSHIFSEKIPKTKSSAAVVISTLRLLTSHQKKKKNTKTSYQEQCNGTVSITNHTNKEQMQQRNSLEIVGVSGMGGGVLLDHCQKHG